MIDMLKESVIEIPPSTIPLYTPPEMVIFEQPSDIPIHWEASKHDNLLITIFLHFSIRITPEVRPSAKLTITSLKMTSSASLTNTASLPKYENFTFDTEILLSETKRKLKNLQIIR